MDYDVLSRKVDGHGNTVAHSMATSGHMFTDPEVLQFANNSRWTVAHEMAMKGHVISDPAMLRLKDDYEYSVAHVMASRGYVFTDPEILSLIDNRGITVFGYMPLKTMMMVLGLRELPPMEYMLQRLRERGVISTENKATQILIQ